MNNTPQPQSNPILNWILGSLLGFGLIALAGYSMYRLMPAELTNQTSTTTPSTEPTKPTEPEPTPNTQPQTTTRQPEAELTTPINNSIPLATRKDIFVRYSAEEEKLVAEAEKTYPSSDPKNAISFETYYNSLLQDAYSRLAKEFKVSKNDVESISVEGLAEGWSPF